MSRAIQCIRREEERANAGPSTHHPQAEVALGAPFAQDDSSGVDMDLPGKRILRHVRELSGVFRRGYAGVKPPPFTAWTWTWQWRPELPPNFVFLPL